MYLLFRYIYLFIYLDCFDEKLPLKTAALQPAHEQKV